MLNSNRKLKILKRNKMGWKNFYIISMIIAIGGMIVFGDNPETFKIASPIMYILVTGDYIIKEIRNKK